MVDVAQLQSSIINREIAEQKHRPVPLLYRRFTDQFEQPTDTTLLQAMLLALTNHKEDIPNVVKATDNSQFSSNIRELNPANAGQATTGQEHRHNQVKNGVTVGSEDTPVSNVTPDSQGDVPVPSGPAEKASSIKPHPEADFKEKTDNAVSAKQELYTDHLNLRGAIKEATENKNAISELVTKQDHQARLEEMEEDIKRTTELHTARIKNIISQSQTGGDTESLSASAREAVDVLSHKIKEGNQLNSEIQVMKKKLRGKTKDATAYTNADGATKGAVEKVKLDKKKTSNLRGREGKQKRLTDSRAKGMR
jgi:hypothetical protein